MRAWICDDTAYVYLLDSSCAALFVFFLRLPSSYSFPFLSPYIKNTFTIYNSVLFLSFFIDVRTHFIRFMWLRFSSRQNIFCVRSLFYTIGVERRGSQICPPPLRHRSLRAYAFLQSKLNLTFERPVAYRAVTSGALKLIAEHLVSRKYLLLY